MTEATALQEMQKGSQRGLEWMIDTYNPYVSTIVYHIIGSQMTQGDVEETVSDVFLTLWHNAYKIKPHMTKPYLAAIARNRAKKKLRERGLTMKLEEAVITVEAPNPEQLIEQREQRWQVR